MRGDVGSEIFVLVLDLVFFFCMGRDVGVNEDKVKNWLGGEMYFCFFVGV